MEGRSFQKFGIIEIEVVKVVKKEKKKLLKIQVVKSINLSKNFEKFQFQQSYEKLPFSMDSILMKNFIFDTF